mmetsp:Transcript_18011/g.43261  ORF Transcript_18011/g.43261 Transcript_18011/m.43261 type:complete len:189 (-) Transcript_18011:319-885(-)
MVCLSRVARSTRVVGHLANLDAGATVTLRAADGTAVLVHKEAAKLSPVLADMLSDSGDDEVEIPLSTINSHILFRIAEYCTHHLVEPESKVVAATGKSLMDCGASSWDATFVGVMYANELQDLSVAADFLAMDGLVRLACAQQARNLLSNGFSCKASSIDVEVLTARLNTSVQSLMQRCTPAEGANGN